MHIIKLIDKNKKERIKVTLGIQDGTFVEILSPELKVTDKILINSNK